MLSEKNRSEVETRSCWGTTLAQEVPFVTVEASILSGLAGWLPLLIWMHKIRCWRSPLCSASSARNPVCIFSDSSVLGAKAERVSTGRGSALEAHLWLRYVLNAASAEQCCAEVTLSAPQLTTCGWLMVSSLGFSIPVYELCQERCVKWISPWYPEPSEHSKTPPWCHFPTSGTLVSLALLVSHLPLIWTPNSLTLGMLSAKGLLVGQSVSVRR